MEKHHFGRENRMRPRYATGTTKPTMDFDADEFTFKSQPVNLQGDEDDDTFAFQPRYARRGGSAKAAFLMLGIVFVVGFLLGVLTVLALT